MLKMFKRFEPFLDADDGLDVGGAESGVEEPEVAETVEEEGVEEQEPAEPVIEGKTERDSAFAEMRRTIEGLQRENAELRTKSSQYDETLGLFFDSENKIAAARAHYEGVSEQEVLNRMEAERKQQEAQSRLEALEAENNRLRFNELKAMDLQELRAAGITDVKDVQELGEAFFRYRTNGLNAVEAYEFIKRNEVTPPKSMGKIKTSPAEKEFFTRDEVASMSSEERFKNVDKIRRSIPSWK
jgi:hypothetical protein